MKNIVIIMVLSFLVGCSTTYQPKAGSSFDTPELKINVEKFGSGGAGTNYFLSLNVENLTSKETKFDSSELELINKDTGISYYSISRDLTELKLNYSSLHIITSTTLKPNRKISGYVLFPTARGKADADELELIYQDRKIAFD
ncbi:MAG: DUF4352 domain-containing protein [Colwellia sp.]